MIFQKLFQLGITDQQPEWLKKKTFVAHTLNYLLIGMGLAFAFFSSFVAMDLVYAVMIGVLVILVLEVLIAVRVNTFSRIILATFPVSLATAYAAILTSADQPAIAVWATLRFAFIATPILLFDLKRERFIFVVVSIINVIIYQSYDYVNGLLEFGIDDTLARDGWFADVTGWGAIVCIFAMLIGIASANLQSENRIAQILEEANDQNDQLKISEAALNGKIQELADKQLLEERNMWISFGLAQFSALFRENEEDLDLLATKTLSKLANYMQVQQGTLYILSDDDNPKMEVRAAWAHTNREVLKQQVSLGEGMVGQCWLEKEEIYINDVPQSHVNIESGMGAAAPASVFLVPVQVNNKVYGVIELAALRGLETHERELVRKLSEILAITINSVKNYEHTAKLLKNAEEMSEQLLAQEEEMRLTAEDIQASHEEQSRRIKMLEEQLAAAQQ